MTPTTEALLEAARDVQRRAYAPYSRFAVGAALRTSDGEIFAGCNVENASYGLTLCAERVALVKAISDGITAFKRVAVVTDGDQLGTCCGGCRQRLREFAALDTPIHVAGPDGIRATFTLEQLLPFSFGPEHVSGL